MKILDSMADLSCPASRLMMIDPSVTDSLPSKFNIMIVVVVTVYSTGQYTTFQRFDIWVVIRGVNLNSVEYRSDRLYAYENYVSLVPADGTLVAASNVEDIIAAHVKISERSGKVELMDEQTQEEFIRNEEMHMFLIFIGRDNCLVHHLTEIKKTRLVHLANIIF